MELLFILAGVMGVAFLFTNASKTAKVVRKRAAQKELLLKFPNSGMHISDDDLSYCVFDFDTSKIVLGLWRWRGHYPNRELPYQKAYEFSDVVDMEVHVNGIPIASTGPNFQPVDFDAKTPVEFISFVVRVLDRLRPVHRITFLKMDEGKGERLSSLSVQRALTEIQNTIAHAENPAHLAEREGETADAAPKRLESEPLASQLRNFLEIKKSGTTDE